MLDCWSTDQVINPALGHDSYCMVCVVRCGMVWYGMVWYSMQSSILIEIYMLKKPRESLTAKKFLPTKWQNYIGLFCLLDLKHHLMLRTAVLVLID